MDYFVSLRLELEAATKRANARARTAKGGRRLVVRLAAAVLVILGAAVPAAALTRTWPFRERDGLVRTGPQTVIAVGRSDEFGRWRAFLSRSASGPCLAVEIENPPGDGLGYTSEGCGSTLGRRPATLKAVGAAPHIAIFGITQGRVDHVFAETTEGSVEVKTTAILGGRGAFYFVSLPGHVTPTLIGVSHGARLGDMGSPRVDGDPALSINVGD